MTQKTPESNVESGKADLIFGSLLTDSGQKNLDDHQIVVILDALANAADAGLVARFPAVLAICARRGLGLNYQALFSRYLETNPKRQNLEKLLLASEMIFNLLRLEPPINLTEIADSLKSKYKSNYGLGISQLGYHFAL